MRVVEKREQGTVIEAECSSCDMVTFAARHQ